MTHDIVFTPSSFSGWRAGVVHNQLYSVHSLSSRGEAWLDHYCISRRAYSPKDRQNLQAAAARSGLFVFVAWENVLQTLTQEAEPAQP